MDEHKHKKKLLLWFLFGLFIVGIVVLIIFLVNRGGNGGSKVHHWECNSDNNCIEASGPGQSENKCHQDCVQPNMGWHCINNVCTMSPGPNTWSQCQKECSGTDSLAFGYNGMWNYFDPSNGTINNAELTAGAGLMVGKRPSYRTWQLQNLFNSLYIPASTPEQQEIFNASNELCDNWNMLVTFLYTSKCIDSTGPYPIYAIPCPSQGPKWSKFYDMDGSDLINPGPTPSITVKDFFINKGKNIDKLQVDLLDLSNSLGLNNPTETNLILALWVVSQVNNDPNRTNAMNTLIARINTARTFVKDVNTQRAGKGAILSLVFPAQPDADNNVFSIINTGGDPNLQAAKDWWGATPTSITPLANALSTQSDVTSRLAFTLYPANWQPYDPLKVVSEVSALVESNISAIQTSISSAGCNAEILISEFGFPYKCNQKQPGPYAENNATPVNQCAVFHSVFNGPALNTHPRYYWALADTDPGSCTLSGGTDGNTGYRMVDITGQVNC